MLTEAAEVPAPTEPTPEAPRVLAIANQKGGVGKTTTAINLATALAGPDCPVLLIDLDPQGNASTGLGIGRNDRRDGSYRLLLQGGGSVTGGQPTVVAHLSIITAEPDLAGAEIELVAVQDREYRLRQALASLRLTGPAFRFIIIDCPPSLGLLTLNALVAATGVIVPLQCEFFALEGLTQLNRTIEMVRRRLNPSLRLAGIVLTMFDRRNNLSDLVAEDARGFFGDRVFQTVIPRNIRVSEAPSHGKPVSLYDPRSAGALAYADLAAELLRREFAIKDPLP